MRKLVLVAVVAVGLSVLGAPSAGASGSHGINGGCGFSTTDVVGDAQVGAIYDVSVTTTGDVVPQPIGATVTCWIAVNGVEAPGTRHSYGDVLDVPGVQAGADVVSFTAGILDYVGLCQTVDYADGTSESECSIEVGPQFPPQVVWDLVDAVEQPVHDVACGGGPGDVCAAVCPATKLLAGRYGPILVTSDGDVYVGNLSDHELIAVYDCPPAGIA